MSLIDHAKQELKILGYTPLDQEQEDGPNKWVQEDLLELLEVFAKQGHSGSSAPYVVSLFAKLAMFEPIAPLQGTDDEWNEVGNGIYQNRRNSAVFKDGKDGQAYFIHGKIFREPSGVCYTSRDSRVFLTFPCTPKSVYVDVPASSPETD